MKSKLSDCSCSDAWRLILLLSLGFWGSVTLLALVLYESSLSWAAG
ncbi:hypothetical protein ACR6A7_16185 [Pantoea sp. RRHST58]